MDRGGYQHALSRGGGALEHRGPHQFPLGFVQQIVLPLGGLYPEIGGGDEGVDRVRVGARRVDNPPGEKIAPRGVQPEPVRLPFDAGHGAASVELAAVDYRRVRQGDGHLPRADNSRRGRP